MLKYSSVLSLAPEFGAALCNHSQQPHQFTCLSSPYSLNYQSCMPKILRVSSMDLKSGWYYLHFYIREIPNPERSSDCSKATQLGQG